MAITLNDRINDLLSNPKPFKIGVFSVHDSYATCYRGVGRKKVTDEQLAVLKQNWGKVEYSGNISNNTKRKIRTMLTGWSRALITYNRLHGLSASKEGRRIVFVTLTLPSKQIHSDNEIKRACLSLFLSNIIRLTGVKYYYWKAESQQNGNIHFHLLLDSFVHKSLINYYWDKALSNLGYIEVPNDYNLNYRSPSTKIEAPRNSSSTAIYVVKYCLKDDGHRKIDGRIWGCSDELRNIPKLSVDLTDEYMLLLNKGEKLKKITIIPNVYCDVYVGNVYGLLFDLSPTFRDEADLFYYEVYHSLY